MTDHLIGLFDSLGVVNFGTAAMASPTYAEPLLSQTDEGPVSSPATALSLGNSSFPNRSQALVRKTRRQALSFVYLASALGAVGGIAVGHQLRLTETSALFRKNATDRSSVSGPNRLPHWLNSSDGGGGGGVPPHVVPADPPHDWQVADAEAAWLWYLGAGLGAAMVGFVADRFGRRFSMRWAAAVAAIGSCVMAAAPHGAGPVMYLGRLLSGAASGHLAALIPIYISEIAPPEIRGEHCLFFQVGVALGELTTVTLISPAMGLLGPSLFAFQIIPCSVLFFGT